MISRSILLYFLLVLSYASRAQMSNERSALKNLDRQRFEKANKQVKKLLVKDTSNVVARYLMAVYFSSPNNSGSNVDSAYHFTMASLRGFAAATPRMRDRIKRFPLDSAILIGLREKIDSTAFARARQNPSEASYTFFLKHFPYAKETSQAIELRAEAAYQEAMALHTLQSLQYYFNTYPQSSRVAQVQAAYDKLLFESETRSQRLDAYENFLRRHPSSPFREETIRQIFNISTASGQVVDFLKFMERFPGHPLARRAMEISRNLEIKDPSEPDSAGYDKRSFLIPILHDNHFGFMDALGNEVIPPLYGHIQDAYRCGNLNDAVLLADGKLISSAAQVLSTRTVDNVTEIGNGFWLASQDQCSWVVHQAGFEVGDGCVEDVRLISGKFLALKKDSKWMLWALNGIRIGDESFDDITNAGDVLIVQTGQKYKLATAQAAAAVANRQPLTLTDGFDECKVWNDSLVWLRAGNFQGVMNQKLDVLIPFGNGSLTPSFFGAIRRDNAVQLYNQQGKPWQHGADFQMQYPSVLLKNDAGWTVLQPLSGNIQAGTYDSAVFKGPFIIGIRKDTTYVVFHRGKRLRLTGHPAFEFVPGLDSLAFLIVGTDKERVLYNQDGKKLFAFTADKVQHAGQNYFVLTRKEKRGIAGSDGKMLTPFEYDAIGSVRDGNLSLLKGGKFGLYDPRDRKLIKPAYVRNILSYNIKTLTAFNGTAWGFLQRDGKPLGKFEYDEIKHWSDTVALVKKKSRWMLLDVKTQETRFDDIHEVRFIRDTPAERLAVINQGGRFGVISSTRGVIIPFNFSDLVNVGSIDDPVYFTEKHVEEAALFVVIYYSGDGKFIRKEVYESDDYERIYCGE